MEWQGHLNAVALQCVVIYILLPGNIVLIIGGYADVFDATMICLAMFTLNFFHPSIYLRGDDYPSPTSSEGTVREERPGTTPGPNLEKTV